MVAMYACSVQLLTIAECSSVTTAMGPAGEASDPMIRSGARLFSTYPSYQRTACFLKASLSTNCVLLESQLVNELRSSFAQTSCKECASLRQAVRSALRSAGRKGRVILFRPATDCVLLVSQLANGLRPSKAQASCKE